MGPRLKLAALKVITGPMFSGKSEEADPPSEARPDRSPACRVLQARHRPALPPHGHRLAQRADARCGDGAQCRAPAPVALSAATRRRGNRIDEAQFFDSSLVQLTGELVHLGKRIILAGLDTTFTGDPFGPIPALWRLPTR